MPTVTINSQHSFYRSRGPATSEQPPLVLLHGSGGDSTVWEAQIEAFADKHTVIAPDLPGHGKSAGKPLLGPEQYADWLKQLIESLNFTSIVLAGHSMGGIIAQEYARKYPKKLKGLVLIGTGMHFDIPQGYKDMLRQDFEAACRVSGTQAYAGQISDALLESGLAMLRRNGPETLARDLQLCNDFDSTDWCRTLSVACLVICGQQDSITPVDLSCELAQAINGSTLKIIDASGHMVMQEQPSSFNTAVLEFTYKQCRPLA